MASVESLPNQALASMLDIVAESSTGSSFSRFLICIDDLITGAASGILGCELLPAGGSSTSIKDGVASRPGVWRDTGSPLICAEDASLPLG